MRYLPNKLLLFMLAACSIVSCIKEEHPQPIVVKNIKKVSWSQHDFVSYEYNAAGFVTKHIAQWENGTGSVNKLTNEYTYDAFNHLMRWQNEAGYATFEYKNGVLDRSVHYAVNGKKISNVHYVFQNKRLITVIEQAANPHSDDVKETRVIYTYYPDGNVKRMDFAYRKELADTLKINFSKVFATYDNKANPEPDGVLGVIIPGVVLHKNNPVKIITVLPNNTEESYRRYEYNYNASNLPEWRTQYIATNGVELSPITSAFIY